MRIRILIRSTFSSVILISMRAVLDIEGVTVVLVVMEAPIVISTIETIRDTKTDAAMDTNTDINTAATVPVIKTAIRKEVAVASGTATTTTTAVTTTTTTVTTTKNKNNSSRIRKFFKP